jgi:anion-transporting  ArsA/GET3 family ATPase
MPIDGNRPLVIVVGAGGVGKTTLAAALGVDAAHRGHDTLVMTFDPSMRLKDALGVGTEAADRAVPVRLDAAGHLEVSLLDARSTFDRLVRRYAPDQKAAQRIFENRFYRNLAGSLAGVLEYMAVERLFEVAQERRYAHVILDTPPTRQALDFLEAPDRILGFLDSGALELALRPWFDDAGHLKLPIVGRGVEAILDRVIGFELLRDMAEFFRAFGPLYEGFRTRALEVHAILRRPETTFVLVAGPGEKRIPETLYFARRLHESGHHVGSIVVNQTHPVVPTSRDDLEQLGPAGEGIRLLAWLGERDRRGMTALRDLVAGSLPLLELPLLPSPPTGLTQLASFGRLFRGRLARTTAAALA